MACWLVLQPGLRSVEFSSVGKTYHLEKPSVDNSEPNECLNEMEALLEEA